MDPKRVLLAIAISFVILFGYQFLAERYFPQPRPNPAATHTTASNAGPGATPGATPGAAPQAARPALPPAPRVVIAAPALRGSISLRGARIDDVVLNEYRTHQATDAPNVRLFARQITKHPYYAQFGWSAAAGTHLALPGPDTIWTASAGALTPHNPVTLTWNNGAGLTFHIVLRIDDHYMFAVTQSVANTGPAPVALFPWERIRRDYTPPPSGYYILFEGLTGVAHDRLQEMAYAKAKSDAKGKQGNIAYHATSKGGWAGFTDKYWLGALVPDQTIPTTLRYRYIPGGNGHYQVDYAPAAAETIAPGGTASLPSHLFVGAKVVNLLDVYESRMHIPQFDKAVDFGWFYWITKPIFYALDYFNGLLGNFGLAILAFTVCVKLLFFPLANYSYRSMSKMRLLAPKVAAMRERLKDDPQKQQQEMMALYKTEKVNPASGCLPMVVQIPVFFSLYKVIFITIEMRQAPFYGWIHNLSVVDPTNLFTLFGLIPWHPSAFSPFLHLGILPILMGLTMFGQQKLNPPPPDPMQAKLFLLMPVIFTFMMGNFPAGLVLYWTWNNLLSIGQQWLIMRSTRLSRPGLARS